MQPASNAGTSKASQAFWQVEDVEAEVAELKTRGVKFEEYDMPGVTMKNSIATAGGAKPPGSRTPREIFWRSAKDAKTKLTFHQATFRSIESRDGHEEGWSSSFDLLTEYPANVKEKNMTRVDKTTDEAQIRQLVNTWTTSLPRKTSIV